MNWEAIGAVGEIIGAIAVVVTLLYLSSQIRINTKAVRTSTFFAANDALSQWQLRVAESAVFRPIVQKVNRGEVELSADEWFQLDYVYRALFNSFGSMHIQYLQGFFDEELREKRMGTCKWMVTTFPVFEKWWGQEKERGIQDSRYVVAIENAKPISGATYLDAKNAT